MPNEAQLKAQMQAAIAKKKQATTMSRSDVPEDTSPSRVSSGTPNSDSESQQPPAPPTEVKEPFLVTNMVTKPLPEEKHVSAPTKPEPTNPPSLTFFSQAIRFTTHRGHVYFAIDDILPLSNNADAQNNYIEFKNQPSTREKAESLIKNVTFTGENGTEKLDAAKGTDVIRVLIELKLSCPGPLGNWLDEISRQYKPTSTTDDQE